MSVRLDHGDIDLAEVHEINVTPFIDVILVLLIIFMIAAPLATVDVAVDLPTSNAQRQPRPDKPLFLTVKADLSLALGDDAVSRDGLKSALDQATGGDRDQRIFLRADKSVSYGDLMGVMNALRATGYLKVALVGLELGRPLMAYVDVHGLGRGHGVLRWSICAAVVVMAHGLLAAALLAPAEEFEEDAGAPVVLVELAPLSVGPTAPPEDLAPGPQQMEEESEQRAAAAPKPEEKPPEVKTEAEASPAPNPAVVVPPPTPEPAKELPEEKSPQDPTQATPVPTAPAPAVAPAPTPAAPAPGRVERPTKAAITRWQRLLEAHLERFKRYPPQARVHGDHGVASVAFTIDHAGHVLSAKIMRSSGSSILDGETLAMIQRAAPLPAPPGGMPDQQLYFVVPIRYGAR